MPYQKSIIFFYSCCIYLTYRSPFSDNMEQKSIIVHLVNGTMDGPVSAELMLHGMKAIKIPRSEFSEGIISKMFDTKTGVYILFCDNNEVYIGEAMDIPRRLNQHQNKDWSVAIAFIGRDLNKTYIQYLEDRLFEICKSSGYGCLTQKTYKEHALKEYEKASMESFLENIKLLSEILEYPITQREKASDAACLYCTGNGADASGFVKDGEFIVLKGSKVSDRLSTSIPGGYKNLREYLESSGIIVQGVFECDYSFSSPSAASSVIIGRSSNGRTEWKTKAGTPLKDLSPDESL